MEFKTARKRALGLGSAKEGVHHWWAQRVSALALVPLSVWFATSLMFLSSAGYGEWRAWVASSWNFAGMALFLIAVSYHAYLGLQVVLEDYLPDHGKKIFWLVTVQFLLWLAMALGLVSLLKIFIGI